MDEREQELDLFSAPAPSVAVPQTVIDASAGCGKTEALGIRMIAMLLGGISPESMITMTFTRAAAAEIYERLLKLLYSAAMSPEKRQVLEQQLNGQGFECPPETFRLTEERLTNLLRIVIQKMNSIKISTLDSFMAQIVQSFPFELGLPGNVRIISAHEEQTMNEQILRKLLNSAHDLTLDDDFIDVAKDATFGKEDKMIFDACLDLIRTAQQFFEIRNSDPEWTHFQELKRLTNAELCEIHQIFQDFFHDSELFQNILGDNRKKVRAEEFMALVDHCCNIHSVNATFTAQEKQTLNAFFLCFDELANGGTCKPASFAWVDHFPQEVRQALAQLLIHTADILLMQTGIRTYGVQKMLQLYSKLYRTSALNSGKLTFADMPRLLNDDTGNDWVMDIAYRLNGKLKHWLLDEFQDTSRSQWQVLSKIIDNIQGSCDRSLFIVGDIKQAIYGWREGDSKLMGEVAEHYELNSAPLTKSYRYGKEISDVLNSLFSEKHLTDSALPEDTVNRWLKTWKPHTSDSAATKPGEFQVFLCNDEDKNQNHATFAKIILKELDRIDPFERGLSAAVLVRNKADGLKLKAEIDNRYPAYRDRFIWEGDETIDKDRSIAAILAFLTYLQHPGDTSCREIAAMCGSTVFLLPETPEGHRKLAAELLLLGYHDFLLKHYRNTKWIQDRNMETLLTAAAEFDRTGLRSALLFHDFVASYKQSGNALDGKVRIMTIHHSKGLGFDIVFAMPMSNPNNGNLRRRRYGEFIKKFSRGRKIEWVLSPPGNAGEISSEIRQAAQNQLVDSAFEDLCGIYVALTRAKRSVSLLLPNLSQEKRKKFVNGTLLKEMDAAYYMTDFLTEAFRENFRPGYDANLSVDFARFGVRDWYPACTPPKQEPNGIEPLRIVPCRVPKRRIRRTPSISTDTDFIPHLRLPIPGKTGGGMDFGTEVHKLFEQIDFVEDPVGIDWSRTDAAQAEQVRKSLENPEIRALLSRGDTPCILWKEQPFEIILDGEWVSGTFDRVQIHFEADGKTIREVRLIDYKSNETTPETCGELVPKYLPQMSLYQRVLTQMLNVPKKQIHAWLLFSRIGKALPLLTR